MGYSEHQTGLAVDINADGVNSTGDQVYKWLKKNAWQYGFILRYPSDKEDLTGTAYEPWHYRYVGRNAAEENGNYRLHYYTIEDSKNKDIFWMIPISSKVEKYKKIVSSKIKRNGKCSTIVIGIFAGEEKAFLIQNAFPVKAVYLDHVHTIQGNPITVHKKLDKELRTKLKEVIAMKKRGINLFFTDVDMILEVMSRLK